MLAQSPDQEQNLFACKTACDRSELTTTELIAVIVADHTAQLSGMRQWLRRL
jgi:hypothetical protein